MAYSWISRQKVHFDANEIVLIVLRRGIELMTARDKTRTMEHLLTRLGLKQKEGEEEEVYSPTID